MAFPNQFFWMEKDVASVNENETNYGNSSGSELKRSHQWFIDGPGEHPFASKKQAVGVSNMNLFSGFLNSNVSPWANASSFQSLTSPSEHSFGSETNRTVNFDNRISLSVGSEKSDMGRKVDEDSFRNDSIFGLSMCHTLEDPRLGLNYGGIRKVKVSQVKESQNMAPASMELLYNGVGSNAMPTDHVYGKTDEGTIQMGLADNKKEEDTMSIVENYERENNTFISTGQTYSPGHCSVYKEDGNKTIAMVQTFGKIGNGVINMGQTFNTDENAISMGHIYDKGNNSSVSMGQMYHKADNSNLSMGRSYIKEESTIISFGGDNDDSTNYSSRIMSNYELLMAQPSLQNSEVAPEKELIKTSCDELLSTSHITSCESGNLSRKKEDPKMSKKTPANNFPSNVRSLLSTGMLDGVPVKYIAWSREKQLHGVIKGSGYLCSCQTCNFSKVINAYEFERHADCKTKHPNNHIYFESGKTVYGIVQELRSTPQNMLFDVMQTITGSPINEKSFRLWKESFLAATRELQRIYGKDEGTL
uniref:Uncharacterized protein MANES_09G086500 n=1 Tax=Rhizophora mucronata TaxID=61149 RepID=A0A2P2K6B5_RHIMU